MLKRTTLSLLLLAGLSVPTVAFAEDRDRRHDDDSGWRDDDDDDRDRDRDRDGHWERDRDGHWERDRDNRDDYDYVRDDGPRVLDSQYANARSGRMTFDLDRRYGRSADLQLVASDRSIRIRSVMVTYSNGRTQRINVRGRQMTIDLNLKRRRAIESITVTYVNRGYDRDGQIALVTQ